MLITYETEKSSIIIENNEFRWRYKDVETRNIKAFIGDYNIRRDITLDKSSDTIILIRKVRTI